MTANASATRWGSPIERLMARVDPNGPGGCWLWTGPLNWNGYGAGVWLNGRRTSPHRALYELLVGSIPEGLDLDHLCRVRRCVNPKHLEPVTRSENLRRGETGGWCRRLTHCVNGHPFDETNTYRDPRGFRGCRTCRSEASRRFKANRRAAR